MALVIADGGPNGRADPAYDAHSLPLGEWAMAVWENWKPISSMQLVIDDAKQRIEKNTEQMGGMLWAGGGVGHDV